MHSQWSGANYDFNVSHLVLNVFGKVTAVLIRFVFYSHISLLTVGYLIGLIE